MSPPVILLLKTPIMPAAALREIPWHGETIVVENEAGSLRTGPRPDGTMWETIMPFAYGFVKNSRGVDGDEVDIYIGPDLDTAPMVYVVHQHRAGDWTRYDEDKAMAGFLSEDAAREAFLACYDDPRFLGDITAIPVAEFVRKVRATRRRPAMIKAHVSGYIKKDGTIVNPHEDSRATAQPRRSHEPPNVQELLDHVKYLGGDRDKDLLELSAHIDDFGYSNSVPENIHVPVKNAAAAINYITKTSRISAEHGLAARKITGAKARKVLTKVAAAGGLGPLQDHIDAFRRIIDGETPAMIKSVVFLRRSPAQS